MATAGDACVAWATDLARRDGEDAIETSCPASNTQKVAWLSRHGFQCFGDPYLFQALQLTKSVPEREVPSDYRVCALNWDAVGLSVTGGEPFPRWEYDAMRRAPGYRPDLDVKAYCDDTVVAGCICWLDAIDRSGELEPVGTHAGHRRMGLAAACTARALNALRGHGARWGCVRVAADNLPAVRLYQSLGFRTVDEDLGWRLRL